MKKRQNAEMPKRRSCSVVGRAQPALWEGEALAGLPSVPRPRGRRSAVAGSGVGNRPRLLQSGFLLISTVLTLACGCASTTSAASIATTAKSTAAPGKKSDPAAPPSSCLTVQGETVNAEEIWLPHMDELRDSSSRELEDYVARQSAELITDKIAEMLLYQKAKLRLTPPMEKKIDEYVDAELRKRVTANYDGIQRRMERNLEQQGWSLDGYRAHIRRSIIISTYLDDELRPKVAEPSRAELIEVFHAVADNLRKPSRRSMSLIDVRVSEFLPAGESAAPDKNDEARTHAKAQIIQAQSELRNGMPFADAAKKYSHGSKAADGGAWGFVNPDSVQERFAPALAKLQTLQPGQVSDVIETPDGFFLIRCDELDPGTNPEFQSIQPQLREQLFARAYNKKVAELVMELRKTARIEPENLEPFHAAVVTAALGKAKALSTLPK